MKDIFYPKPNRNVADARLYHPIPSELFERSLYLDHETKKNFHAIIKKLNTIIYVFRDQTVDWFYNQHLETFIKWKSYFYLEISKMLNNKSLTTPIIPTDHPELNEFLKNRLNIIDIN